MKVATLAKIGALFVALAPAHAMANVINPFETQFDTDWTTAGVGGLRGTGTGDITISGISGSITQAYLYWHGPTNSTDPNFNANVLLNGTAVTGENIGFSDDNFWGQANSQAYRADVTDIVTNDGVYNISGLPAEHANGASIFAFFDDGDDTNNRDVVMFDGNDANFENPYDPVGWDVTLAGINYSGGTAELVFTVSDGQTFTDASLNVNGVSIAGPGDVFQGDTVPQNPDTTVGNGALWDIRSFDVTGMLSPGSNTFSITHGTVSDALSLINIAVDLPAGAAPPVDSIVVPAPPALALLGSGLFVIGWARRKAS
ncbi:PEP-CTERM sorting domain-containing protein [Caenispirillum salinarum]|uniref:PEP-CTERM sorting domain-containing protein n=1 Tax=Caenispirillum salinarum TaxID=859058 RepID=UPI0012671270|nr:PEP-CTERM sorting domain-containing protein [Caenispirillum salinarum]